MTAHPAAAPFDYNDFFADLDGRYRDLLESKPCDYFDSPLSRHHPYLPVRVAAATAVDEEARDAAVEALVTHASPPSPLCDGAPIDFADRVLAHAAATPLTMVEVRTAVAAEFVPVTDRVPVAPLAAPLDPRVVNTSPRLDPHTVYVARLGDHRWATVWAGAPVTLTDPGSLPYDARSPMRPMAPDAYWPTTGGDAYTVVHGSLDDAVADAQVLARRVQTVAEARHDLQAALVAFNQRLDEASRTAVLAALDVFAAVSALLRGVDIQTACDDAADDLANAEFDGWWAVTGHGTPLSLARDYAAAGWTPSQARDLARRLGNYRTAHALMRHTRATAAEVTCALDAGYAPDEILGRPVTPDVLREWQVMAGLRPRG